MYGTVRGVNALIPAVGTIDSDTTPNSSQVTTWLTQATSMIDRTLATAGYTTPVTTSAGVYPEISGLANLYAAAYSLRARGLDTVNADAESRSEQWLQEYRDGLQALASSDLSSVGVTPVTTTGTSTGRRRLRTTQVRRVDGYSAAAEVAAGEYTTTDDAWDQ